MRTFGVIFIGESKRQRYQHKWFWLALLGWIACDMAIFVVGSGFIYPILPIVLRIIVEIGAGVFYGWWGTRFWMGVYQVQTYKYDEGLLPTKTSPRRGKKDDDKSAAV
jgi:hypothetical protein